MKISKRLLGFGISLGLLMFCTSNVEAKSVIIEKIGGKDRYETATKIDMKLLQR